MKPFVKTIGFLVSLTILDFLLRKGFIGFFIPVELPYNLNLLFLFFLFAFSGWKVTEWFCKSDNIRLKDLGISFDSRNRFDFFWGSVIGMALWGLVSVIQAYTAGFSWEWRPNISLFNLIYGLLFIFIADLGTELFYRGYPLKKFEESFGAIAAIIIMMLFVGLRSYSFEAEGKLLFYIILIPVLHTVFFSIIYFKTRRLGAALGIHTGANFVTISIFDLRIAHEGQTIPSGIFQSDTDVESLSLTAIQLPWIIMVILLSFVVFLWWKQKFILTKPGMPDQKQD